MMRIAIAGNGSLALNLMRPLVESGHEVVALVQDGRALKGFRRAASRAFTRVLPLENMLGGYAIRKGIPTVWIDRMTDDELAPLRRLAPDILLVGGFGIILKRPVIDLPRVACINAHTSLLPRHRGPNPFSAVIMQKETETGLTFHLIDEGIDTGDIVAQFAFPVENDDTAYSIYNTGCEIAGEHVVEVMDRIEKEGVCATPQDESEATYDRKLGKDDYRIDWKETTDYYKRLLRASRPFFTPWFFWRGRTIYFVRGKFRQEELPAGAEPGMVVAVRPCLKIATGDGSCTLVSAFGMAPVPWLWPARWHGMKPGDRLGSDG